MTFRYGPLMDRPAQRIVSLCPSITETVASSRTGIAEGIIVCPTAKNGPVFAISADGEGDLTGSKKAIKWVREKNTPDVPSPVILDDLIYLCRENGILLVLDREAILLVLV